jgi:type I restriction enzyme R subunit
MSEYFHVEKPFLDQLAIEDMLDQGLPRSYTPDLYKLKCSAVFEHFYETYGDRGVSIYPTAG